MRAAPAVVLALGYGAGLATGLLRSGDPLSALLLLGALAALTRTTRPMVGLALLAAGAGRVAAWGAWQVEPGRCAAGLKAGEVRLTGVPRDPAGELAPVRFLVIGRCSGDILVRWPSGAAPSVGTLVTVEGRWIPRPDGPARRPGGALIAKRFVIEPGPVPRTLAWRGRLFATTAALYGARAPLVDALLFDRRGAVDRTVRTAYAEAGLVHLLSISGFHVGLIVAWIFLAARGAGLGRSRAWIVATVAALLYVGWLGWPPPATRAAGLAVVTCLARLRQRSPSWGSLLAVTGLGVLVIDPWGIFEVGAWLSVGSLWGATHFARWSDAALGPRMVWRDLAGSVGATVATAPVTAGALGTVALAGIGLNFIGIPLAALAVPGALSSVLVAPVFPVLGRALAAGAGIALALLDQLAHWGARIPFGHLTTATGAGSAVPWVLVLLAVLWVMGRRNTRSVALTRASLLAAAVLWVALVARGGAAWSNGPTSGLRLDFLDVGQGDATVLRTPHGHTLLIDAGPRFGGRDAGRSVVAPFLVRSGVDRLDAVILSHAHLDHFGGIPAVLDRVPSALLLEPGEMVPDSAYLGMLDAAAEDGAGWAPLRAGDTLRVDGVELVVLHPDTTWAEWGLDLNEDSAVLLVRWGRFRALLAGDAGIAAEGRMRGHAGHVDLLKVGHHGSRGASGAVWLHELTPEVAVVSVGTGNRYGHPTREALDRLRAAGASVWRTDRDGGVAVAVDSVAMEVRGAGRRERYVLPAAPPEGP
ncbi:MAG: DNA internalization-related competence protein ComEC/Rec2 [Gemmatimonadales bacterium]